MKYKIALVTNESLHHKYWASELYKNLDIKLIIHPRKNLQSWNYFYSSMTGKVFKYGLIYGIKKLFSLLYNKIYKDSRDNQLARQSAKYFSGSEEEYMKIPKKLFHFTNSINSKSCIDEIKRNEIDFVFFLGGDIAKRDFIYSPKFRSLNFHSGISPFYNGNKTNFHAFVNKDIDLIGGTLMYMNEKIDGGRILAHTSPEIRATDTATSLFFKNIEMSVKVYLDFMQEITLNKHLPQGVEQKEALNYYKNIDWSINQDIKLFFLEQEKILDSFIREERIFQYFDQESVESDIIYKNFQQSKNFEKDNN